MTARTAVANADTFAFAELSELVRRHAALIIVLVAIAASISGITNGFAFDDIHVIVKNPQLHTLASPWGFFRETYWRAEMGSMLYRPMMTLTFAIEWVIGNGSPIPFHIVSVSLYAALSTAVFRLAELLMSRRSAFLAASLFAVHPVHVEAVANVVGQSELWVALILVALITRYIRVRNEGNLRVRDTCLIAVGYLAACGFKEHAIVLPGLLLAAEVFAVKHENNTSTAVRIRSVFPLFIALAVAGVAFVVIRHAVLSGVAIDSTAPIFKGQSFGTRLFTMLGVVTEWVRLFVWPMSLSADYSYPRIATHQSFDLIMMPGIALLMAIPLIGWHLRNQFPNLLFGIAWTSLALLIPSNLLVVTGFVLAERTLMLPSVGFVLCLGIVVGQALVERPDSRTTRLIVPALVVVMLAFGVRSITRSPVWHDNETLFSQTVKDVPSSHRAHWMRAMDLSEKKRVPEALDEMDLAVAMGDQNDPLLLAYAGDMFAIAGRCPRAVTLYRRALALAPMNIQLRANTVFCLMNIGKVNEAKAMVLEIPGESNDPRLQRLLKTADSLQLLHTHAIAKR